MPTRLTLTANPKKQTTGKAYKRNAHGEALISCYDLVTLHSARKTSIILMYLSKTFNIHEMVSVSGHKTESVFFEYIKLNDMELAINIVRKMRKVKNATDTKYLLFQKIKSMSIAEVVAMLEPYKERYNANTHQAANIQ